MPSDAPSLGPDFRRLLAGAAASNLGDGIRFAALPLLAVSLTDQPVLVSGVTAATFLPAVVFGPVGGALVDRHGRRRLMVWGQVLRGIAAALFALALFNDVAGIWAVYLLAAVLGAGEVVVDSASQAVIPSLVPPSLLERANGRMISVQLVLDEMVGAALGGLLFVVAPMLPFLVDAVTFGVGGALIAAVSVPLYPDDQASPTDDGPSLWASAREGFAYLSGHPLLRRMALAVSLSNLANVTGISVLVLLVVDELGASEAAFGFVVAAGAVGGVIASTVAERLVARFGRAVVLVGACVVDAVAALVIASAQDVVTLGLGMAVLSGAIMAFNVPGRAVRQEVTPDRLLGRVVSSYRVIGYFGVPIGAVLGGVITDLVDVRAAFIVMAVLLAFVTVIMNRAVQHLPDAVTSGADADTTS